MNWVLTYQIICKIFVISTIIATFSGVLIYIVGDWILNWLYERGSLYYTTIFEIKRILKKIYLSVIVIVLSSLCGIVIFAIFK